MQKTRFSSRSFTANTRHILSLMAVAFVKLHEFSRSVQFNPPLSRTFSSETYAPFLQGYSESLLEIFPCGSCTDSPSHPMAVPVFRHTPDGTPCISVSWNPTTNVALTMHAGSFLPIILLRRPYGYVHPHIRSSVFQFFNS